MSASRQGMSSEENGQGSDHGRDSNQQQSKRIEVVRAHATRVGNKKAYAGNLSYCNKCKWHHIRLCTVKCGNYKRVGHTTNNCRTSAPAKTKRALVANQKPAVTCFGCGAQRHFKSKCPRLKNQMYDNQKKKEGKIRKNSKAMAAYEANQNGNGNPNVNVGGVVPVAHSKAEVPNIVLKPLNREFNALNELESRRWSVNQMQLIQYLEQMVHSTVQIPRDNLVVNAKQLQIKVEKNAADIHEHVKLVRELVRIIDLGEQHSTKEVHASVQREQISFALVIYSPNDEPPAKKLKVVLEDYSIPSPTPLNSIRPTIIDNIPYKQFISNLFSSGSSEFSPTPPPRMAGKGKGIA
ncbi:hypothetical protein Tco_0359177 [Tanacetum coccineum]